MSTLATTTLSRAVGAGTGEWSLAAVSGITSVLNASGACSLFCGGELVTVTARPVGLSVMVIRGAGGTPAGSHPSGATVYIGPPGEFYQSDPVGVASNPATTPWINVVDNRIWTVSSSTWVLATSNESAASPTITGTVGGSATYSTATLADPVITLSAGTGSFADRVTAIEAFAVDGAALHAAVLPAWTAPAAAVILRAWLNITTVATGACTIDVGYTAVSGTTSSDTLLDGVDANAATALFDSMDATLDSGANAHAQLAASGKWVTIDEKTGDSTGLVAVLYIQYALV